MEDRLSKLPKGWVWTTFERVASNDKNAIVDGPFGSNLKLSDYIDDENGVPVLTTKNLEYGYGKQFVRYISKDKFQELKRSEVKGGDILVAKIGSCGKVSIYPENFRSAMIPANLLKMTVHSEIKKLYIFHFINSPFFKNELENITTATAQPAFNVTKFRKLPIPLPPLPEQHRIVAKIEELFTRLDAGVEALKKIKVQLKRYRQAVLKYAFEGKLTQEWREAHKGELEPASVLLKRIKEQRKKEAKGKLKELPPIDTSELPELPEGWEWTRIGLVCSKIQDGSHFSPKIQFDAPGDGRYLYITAKNIKGNGIELSEVTYIDSSFHRAIYSRCNPEKGDVLLIKDGVKTGIATVNTLEDEFSLLSSVALFKPNRVGLQHYYLKHFLNSPVGFKMTTEKMTGTAIKRIILEKVRSAYIPLPSFLEQQKIVEEIESRLSIADNMGKVAEQSLKQSDRLRQSILKWAFEGRLVPQDPTDEPAGRLLERIKEEKVKSEAENEKQKKHKNKKSKQMELI